MSKYGNALGTWELKVNDAVFNLTPKMGDNKRLLNIMLKAKETKNEGKMLEDFEKFIYDVIARDYPPANEEEKKELATMIEFNVIELLKKTMIAFRFTTEEEYEKIESQTKKGTLQAEN